MYQNFESLPTEKKQKIIGICMEEFAEHGYVKASTNAIVKKAGISKGILFHYFGSKKNLYFYIIDHIMDYFVDRLKGFDGNMSKDLFEKIWEWTSRKMNIMSENPVAYKILLSIFNNTPDELRKEVIDREKRVQEIMMPHFVSGLDTSLFRKDIPSEKIIQFVIMSIEEYSFRRIEQLSATGELGNDKILRIIEECKDYVEILKNGVYER